MIGRFEPWELTLAAKVGTARNAYAIANGLTPQLGREPHWDRLPWDAHIEGAAAELLVAKTLDRYWDAYVGPPKGRIGDVGLIEVRATRIPNGNLIVRGKDRDDAVVVLVVGRCPNMDVVGWVLAGDAKREDYQGEPDDFGRPTWWVPQTGLRPIADLIR